MNYTFADMIAAEAIQEELSQSCNAVKDIG